MEYSLMYSDIVELTKRQFEQCRVQLNINKDIKVYNERTFEGIAEGLDENTIYVIVHFEQGTIMLGGTIQPIYLEIISETNTMSIAYELATTYGLTFNYNVPTVESGAFVQQVYTTPQVVEEQAEDGEHYRAILSMNGTMVYGENISGISSIQATMDGGEGEEDIVENILFTSVSPILNLTPNTANLGNNNSRTTTKNKSASFTITFNMVSQKTKFVELCDNILFGTASVNTQVVLTITKNAIVYTKTLKFVEVALNQQQGGIPTYTVGLTE